MNAETIHLCVLTCTSLNKEKIGLVTIVSIAMKTQEMSSLVVRSVFMTFVIDVKRNQALDALRTISYSLFKMSLTVSSVMKLIGRSISVQVNVATLKYVSNA